MIKLMLITGMGGFVGTCLRFLCNRVVSNIEGLPMWVSTLGVNVIGCFLIGLFGGLATRQNLLSPEVTMMLTVGLCGGLTTFSTFTNEIVRMGQDGNWLLAIAYPLLSLALGIPALLLARHLTVN